MTGRRYLLFVFLGTSLMLTSCSGTREATREEPRTAEPAGRPEAPTTRTVQGFRIQILTTSEKGDATQEAEKAATWWKSLPASEKQKNVNASPVDINWRAPYYRVRMGNFATRNEAQRALSLLARQYPDALIVPDQVTITH